MELLVFYLFAAVAVASALLVVLEKRALYSALALIVCFGAVAVLFFQLGAYFIAAVQVIVYAGAIMVLFLFVVMLVDPESEVFALRKAGNLVGVALPAAVLFALILLSAVGDFPADEALPPDPPEMREIAIHLFTDYVLPFELTAILILVAVLGAIVLAKRTD